MRTTISLPDEVYDAAKELAGSRRERFAYEMDEGYCAEAISPSLEMEWAQVEVDGLGGPVHTTSRRA